jgi:hypothetical protein
MVIKKNRHHYKTQIQGQELPMKTASGMNMVEQIYLQLDLINYPVVYKKGTL